MIKKYERLAIFKARVENDSFIPSTAKEANDLLRKHMNAVEMESLPKKYLGNYTYQMMIPSFDIEGAWVEQSGKNTWKAIEHVIDIFSCGKIEIRTNEGVIWLTKP
ncbi:TPA: hypothetical protein ACQYF6_004036 [Vibrio parahaemolyticus]|uniref:hypothetical protein n=1 Tax=Vibrio parahaemolyticus TaxID=670 RepID=UPI001A3223AE|nr:hypothetical protein [Vibrio parahaemolyticus]EHW0643065.1 hypothetical protein [Vibrio parahaemolyticus]EHZ2741786.1 hypothetical protein [Vibrio parahaemolyticus]MDG2997198.1 hypothetical protein [Vibrio parahaemolyticus]HAS6977759.1 hypothetical protein [Vibrio parahaemolyticus]